jgi:hypothetical protein
MRILPILAFAGLSSASDTLAVNVGGATVSMTGSGPLWGVLLILATIGGPLLANYAQTRWHIKAGIDVKPDKAP